MNSIGVDLHKKSIKVCVMSDRLRVLEWKTLHCDNPDAIVESCRQHSLSVAQ